MNHRRLLVSLLLAILAGTLLAGCSPSTPTPEPPATQTPLPATVTPAAVPPATATATTPPTAPPTQTPTASAQGTLRVIQAAPESGAVDVYLGQRLIAGRLGLGAFTNPIAVETGAYTAQVVPVSALPDTQVLADVVLEIEADQSYFILVSGTAETLTATVYRENLDPIPTGQARLAFLNAVPRGPAAFPITDDQQRLEQIDYGEVSPAYTVEAGSQAIGFLSGEDILADVDTAFAAQQAYTAVLIGQVGGGDYRVVLFSTAVETPGQVRFVHAGIDLPAVDVYIDGVLIGENVDYRAFTDWHSQPPRTASVIITPHGEPPSAALVETRFALGAGQGMTALLIAERGSPALRLFETPLDATPPITAHLVVANAAADAPVAYAVNGDQLLEEIPPVSYGTATRPIAFPSGPLNLLWQSSPDDATARAIEFAGEITFSAGRSYTYIITGTERDPLLLVDDVGINEEDRPATADEETAETGEEPGAAIRVLNALSEPLDIRLRLDDMIIVDGLPPREFSLHTPVEADQYTLRIGAADGPNAPDYFIEPLALLDVTRATIFVYGMAETMDAALLPDYEEPLQGGQAVLRILNAIPESEDLYVTIDIPGIGPTAAPAATSVSGTPDYATETPAAPDFSSYESPPLDPGGATNFIGLPQGEYDIFVRRRIGEEVIAIVPRLALAGDTLYDLILLPGTDDAEVDVQLITNTP